MYSKVRSSSKIKTNKRTRSLIRCLNPERHSNSEIILSKKKCISIHFPNLIISWSEEQGDSWWVWLWVMWPSGPWLCVFVLTSVSNNVAVRNHDHSPTLPLRHTHTGPLGASTLPKIWPSSLPVGLHLTWNQHSGICSVEDLNQSFPPIQSFKRMKLSWFRDLAALRTNITNY